MAPFPYCIRVRGMHKTGRALKTNGISTVPMTFSSQAYALEYMQLHGISDTCYVMPMFSEDDYYIQTWSLEKIQLIKAKKQNNP